MNVRIEKAFLFYLMRFAFAFCVFYYGTKAIIGLSVPGGYYSPFVANHLDYISFLRKILLIGSKDFCNMLGYETYTEGTYFLKSGGVGVRMVYECIGYVVMSFWAAFVISNSGNFIKKFLWIIGGWLIIYFVNVLRISFLLISLITHHKLPFNIDHHTLFNIVAYIIILIMIYFYDKYVTVRKVLVTTKPEHRYGRKPEII